MLLGLKPGDSGRPLPGAVPLRGTGRGWDSVASCFFTPCPAPGGTGSYPRSTGCCRQSGGPAAGGELLLQVADDGPGVDPERAEEVFERGWTTKRAAGATGAGGRGLGLALVRQAARRHGGEATLGRAAAGGAEFTVSLPLGRAGAPDPARTDPEAAAAGAAADPGTPEAAPGGSAPRAVPPPAAEAVQGAPPAHRTPHPRGPGRPGGGSV